MQAPTKCAMKEGGNDLPKMKPNKTMLSRKWCPPLLSLCSSRRGMLILLIVWIGVVRQWRQPIVTLHSLLQNAVTLSTFTTSGSTRTMEPHPKPPPPPPPPPIQQPSQHVVFIGDSALLYSYLEFVDRIHYHRPDNESAPDALIHVERHQSWYQFFQYTIDHFQGYMSCDCYYDQRWSNHSAPSRYSSYQNHFYSYGTVTATYLRGYYDLNDTDDSNDSSSSSARGAHSYHYVARGARDTAASESEPVVQWQYRGLKWDELMRNYVSRLKPKPTAIVLHAGMRPNDDIAINMGRILKAARLVVGENGIVIWRKSLPRHNETSSQNAPLSPADEAARDWSYRIPGIIYQPFPSATRNMQLTPMDYYDHYHFSQPSRYQQWNMDLNKALWDRPPVQRVAVIVAGAIRTLPRTHHTMMQNLVRQLCPPYSCISHLIVHVSSTDNRPDRKSIDPRGVLEGSPDAAIHPTYFQHPSDYNWPDDYLQFHWVDEPYQIGTSEEQAAMDKYEEEFRQHQEPNSDDSPQDKTKLEEIVRRFSVIRFGDPRRYSMWFARAWAWRYTKKLNISFDFHVFVRPDLLWFLPVPTMTFFREHKQSDREVWVHDRYYANVPDIFAFLPTRTAAENYLSLRHYVHPKAACLGGPDFNSTMVQARLHDMNITVETIDWCPNIVDGFSEQILERKLDQARLPRRYLAFGMAIWRPPSHAIWGNAAPYGMLMCEPLYKTFIIGFWKYPSLIPFWACMLADYALKNNWTMSTVTPSSMLAPPANRDIIPLKLFRWRRLDYRDQACLTRININDTITWLSAPCEDPITVGQMYAEDPTHAHPWLGVDLQRNLVLNITIPKVYSTLWFREPVELYDPKSLERW